MARNQNTFICLSCCSQQPQAPRHQSLPPFPQTTVSHTEARFGIVALSTVARLPYYHLPVSRKISPTSRTFSLVSHQHVNHTKTPNYLQLRTYFLAPARYQPLGPFRKTDNPRKQANFETLVSSTAASSSSSSIEPRSLSTLYTFS